MDLSSLFDEEVGGGGGGCEEVEEELLDEDSSLDKDDTGEEALCSPFSFPPLA